MKTIQILCAVFFSLFSQLALADCPGGTMDKGWCWPTSAGEWTTALIWHGPNPGFSGPHLAKDISANEGDPVFDNIVASFSVF